MDAFPLRLDYCLFGLRRVIYSLFASGSHWQASRTAAAAVSLLIKASISKDSCFCSYQRCNESPLLAHMASNYLPTTSTAVNKPQFAWGVTGCIRIKGTSSSLNSLTQCWSRTSEGVRQRMENQPWGQTVVAEWRDWKYVFLIWSPHTFTLQT